MTKKDPRIADNPSFSKVREGLAAAKLITKLKPLLKLAGVNIGNDLIAKLEGLEESVESLATLPDRFNDLFSTRGWIAYGLMNADLMRLATEMGEAGSLDDAEKVLTEHYDEKTIDQSIKWLYAVDAFRPRERLARLALKDYINGRYHASVPLVLMILDGIVNETHGSRGFFAEGTDLTAWDSIAAHSSGLQALQKVLCKTRQKTTTEPLALPYRNGILHGQDLSYDNKLVAAKTWAALFAIREWALAVRDERVEEPPPEPKPSLKEVLDQVAQAKQDMVKVSEWVARSDDALAKVPKQGNPEDYDPADPEAVVVMFLHLWKKKNFGEMAKRLPPVFRESPSKAAGDMRAEFADKDLDTFAIEDIRDEAPSISEVTVRVKFKTGGESKEGLLECRVVYQDETGMVATRGSNQGAWFFWPRLVLP